MNLIDGDRMTLTWDTSVPHELDLGYRVNYVYVDKIYLLTPAAYRKLARGYMVNFLERWLVTEVWILFRRYIRPKLRKFKEE